MCNRFSYSAESVLRLASALGVDFSDLEPSDYIVADQNRRVIYHQFPLLADFKRNW